jgi:hypothetical protein
LRRHAPHVLAAAAPAAFVPAVGPTQQVEVSMGGHKMNQAYV